MSVSCLYVGAVSHRRLRPKPHRLRYRLFQLYLDLDEAESLGRAHHLFGFNRPALFSFRERDHLAGDDRPLKSQVAALLAGAGLEGGGPVRVLCLPRVLGFVFNPISIFLCHHADGAVSAVIYEVNNTFGGRHSYVLPAEIGPDGVITQSADKALHVSPFMGMDHSYRFRLPYPDEVFNFGIQLVGKDGPWLTAGFSGHRRPLADSAILGAWLSYPLITLMVVAQIHLEALKLWAKGLKYYPNPARKPSKAPALRGGERELETI